MRPMSPPHLLKRALLSNAAFSLVSGLLLLLVPKAVAALLGVDQVGLLRAVGLGLVLFSVQVAHAGQRERIRPLEVLLISLGDFSWVLSSLGLLLVLPASFSLTGVWLVGGVAALVGAFAVAQLNGLRKWLTEPTPGLGQYHYCLAVNVDAPAASMWGIVSNLAAIQRYSPSLSSSVLRPVSSDRDLRVGVGRVRECTSTQQQRWAEEVTRFEQDARSFQVKFLTDETGFPFPMSVMHGGWQVFALPSGQSRVSVWWSITPKVPLTGLAIVAIMAASVERDMPLVIERMAADATGRKQPEGLGQRLQLNGYC